ncbi:hypothetical protein KC363_g25 [Hortaea werneckii]|nr:hypothetical protein KC363_g25 [Hortaea werneckii]
MSLPKASLLLNSNRRLVMKPSVSSVLLAPGAAVGSVKKTGTEHKHRPSAPQKYLITKSSMMPCLVAIVQCDLLTVVYHATVVAEETFASHTSTQTPVVDDQIEGRFRKITVKLRQTVAELGDVHSDQLISVLDSVVQRRKSVEGHVIEVVWWYASIELVKVAGIATIIHQTKPFKNAFPFPLTRLLTSWPSNSATNLPRFLKNSLFNSTLLGLPVASPEAMGPLRLASAICAAAAFCSLTALRTRWIRARKSAR